MILEITLINIQIIHKHLQRPPPFRIILQSLLTTISRGSAESLLEVRVGEKRLYHMNVSDIVEVDTSLKPRVQNDKTHTLSMTISLWTPGIKHRLHRIHVFF